MKKQFLNLGKALNKAEQKLINGGGPAPHPGLKGPCPCTSDYTVTGGGGNECTFPGNDKFFPEGVCLGYVQNGLCCL